MDDLDDITDEERALAAQLAQRLETGGGAIETEQGSNQELDSLHSQAALLAVSDKWGAGADALRRGRKEVESAALRAATSGRAPRRHSWLLWLPLPAAGLLALALGLENPQNEGAKSAEIAVPGAAEESASSPGQSEAPGFERLPQRYHAGQTPLSLLEAQARVLAAADSEQERNVARATWEREMRSYRGTLIAGLELGGR